MCFTIPTIILSTLVGSMQLRIAGSDDEFMNADVEVFLASVNMFVAMIAGLNSLLKYQERAESHRTSSSNFGNFYRQVSCELAFPRSERESPSDLLKGMKRQYDTMLESAPDVPPMLISAFKLKYKKMNLTITLPDVCNGLDPIKVCKHNTFEKMNNLDTPESSMTVLIKK